jgi:hypothetical protein
MTKEKGSERLLRLRDRIEFNLTSLFLISMDLTPADMLIDLEGQLRLKSRTKNSSKLNLPVFPWL